MNIIGTGLSGLVGSRVVELLSAHSFENLSLDTGVDITDREAVRSRIHASQAPWVFHFAAYTNVQQAEQDKLLGTQSIAWKVNVDATETIVSVCEETGKRLLYLDTDYAFDGTKDTYDEDAPVHPLGWYAVTKTEGAHRVRAYNKGLVVRISNPYRAHPVGKTDFVHKMRARLEEGLEITAPDDQLFVPTFIDDLACAVDVLVSGNHAGMYHAVAPSGVSPYEAARIIAGSYGLDTSLIKQASFDEYFAGKAPVPQYARLTGAKLTALGVVMKSFADGLKEVVKQESHI